MAKCGPKSWPTIDRLLEKLIVTENGCWNPQKQVHKGYTKIWDNDASRSLPGHKVTYETMVAPVPEGMELDHLCRNGWCVNPEHLEAVTHALNMERAPYIGRKVVRIICKHGHYVLGANVHFHKSGARRCRECHLKQQRAYDKKRRGK